MRLAHRVALDGVELDEIDNRIIVQGVEEDAGKETISAVSIFGGFGQRVTGRHRDTLDVTVKFSLRIKKNDMEARSLLFEKICGWAYGGGWLTVNYKPNRKLRVACAQLPPAGDQWAWASTYAIVFRAYGVPYWQQAEGNRCEVAGKAGATQRLGIPGTVPTALDVTLENISGTTISTVQVTADGSTLRLEDLGLLDGEKLVIDHEDGLLRVRILGSAWRTALDKRTPASSDDLTVRPGTVDVVLSASAIGTWTLTAVGRFAG